MATAVITLALIGLGGMVTSTEAGMAVPDWPTTFGENMFLFPFSQWVGGVFYEHSHRLLASLVGLLMLILAACIWVKNSNGHGKWLGLFWIVAGMGLVGVRTQTMFVVLASIAVLVVGYCLFRIRSSEAPLRWWAMLGYSLVLIQGVLGGLRVTMIKDQIGIVHGTTAQLFFLLICTIALVTSRHWNRLKEATSGSTAKALRPLLLAVSVIILIQLMLGASMRHQHAGLAVPDFPLAYGQLWPRMDTEFVAQANQARLDTREFKDITGNQILLHMIHRVMAAVIFCAVAYCCVATRRIAGSASVYTKWVDIWFGLVCLQGILGAATVWSNKAAEIATLHVMTGAVCLVLGGLLTIVAIRGSKARALRRTPETEVPCGLDPLLVACPSL